MTNRIVYQKLKIMCKTHALVKSLKNIMNFE